MGPAGAREPASGALPQPLGTSSARLALQISKVCSCFEIEHATPFPLLKRVARLQLDAVQCLLNVATIVAHLNSQ